MRARIFLLLFSGVFVAVSCANRDGSVQTAATEYKVITLDTTTTVIYNEFSTIISSNSVIEVKPKVSGYVVGKYVGSSVLCSRPEWRFPMLCSP